MIFTGDSDRRGLFYFVFNIIIIVVVVAEWMNLAEKPVFGPNAAGSSINI